MFPLEFSMALSSSRPYAVATLLGSFSLPKCSGFNPEIIHKIPMAYIEKGN